MGLFSSRKKTVVGTTVMRVIENKYLPNSIQAGTLKALLQGGDIGPYVLEELNNSLGMRTERMYDYAKRHYTYGLPSRHMYVSTQGQAQVEQVLRETVGPDISVEYSRYGPPNMLHIGWLKLVRDWDYDSVTNKIGRLSRQQGRDVYLVDMQIVLPRSVYNVIEPNAIEQWGRAPNTGALPGNLSGLPFVLATLVRNLQPLVVVDNSSTEHIRVTYGWARSGVRIGLAGGHYMGTVMETATFTISVDDYDEEADYFHAKYIRNGKEYYWMYEVGSGEYEELDALYGAPPTQLGNYLPFLYFRYNKTSMGSNKNSAAYKTSNKLAKYLGLDYDDIIREVHKNPDIKDVEQAMMIFALSPNTNHQLELAYLYDFFNEVIQAKPRNTYQSVPAELLPGIFRLSGNSASAYAITIQDRRFRLTLGYEGIHKRTVGGRIGRRGTYKRRTENIRRRIQTKDHDGLPAWDLLITPSHVFMRQVSENFYEEIRVTGLRMTYHIYGRHVKVGENTDPILLVPVDRTIARRFSTKDREQLYARSLHLVFNSRVTKRVKWYQTGFFSFFISAIAIVLTAFTFGKSLAALSAIQTAFGWGVMFVALFDMMIVPLLVTVGVKLFVDAVGGEIGAIIALVAAVVAVYRIGIAGGIKNAPWAKELLQVSSNLIETSSSDYQKKIQGLMSEARDFSEYVEGVSKLIEQGQDLLEQPYKYLAPIIILGESPKDFYNRTVHSGNVGILSIEANKTFVKRHLRLPTITDTLGGHFNAVV